MSNTVKVLIGEKNGIELDGPEEHNLIADEVPYYNGTSGLQAIELQGAIDELQSTTSTSASPGFSLGRSGNTPSGTWLLRTGGPPSNRTGIPMSITSPRIKGIAVGNQNISTFDVSIYEHEGDEVNLTLLTTVSVVAKRTDSFSVDIAATSGRQLAAKISSGSAKNPGVDLQLTGSN